VRGKEWLSELLVVVLGGLEKTIDPGKQLLGTMVRVKDDGDAIFSGQGTNMEGASNGTIHSRRKIGIIETFAGNELVGRMK